MGTYQRLRLSSNSFTLRGWNIEILWHFDVSTQLLLASLGFLKDLHGAVAGGLRESWVKVYDDDAANVS